MKTAELKTTVMIYVGFDFNQAYKIVEALRALGVDAEIAKRKGGRNNVRINTDIDRSRNAIDLFNEVASKL